MVCTLDFNSKLLVFTLISIISTSMVFTYLIISNKLIIPIQNNFGFITKMIYFHFWYHFDTRSIVKLWFSYFNSQTLNDSNCFYYPIPLHGNNVVPLIMCHFNIPQPWSSQHDGIFRIYHIVLKYSKCSYVRNFVNIYLHISNQTHWFCGYLIYHLHIIWCRFRLWKPQS